MSVRAGDADKDNVIVKYVLRISREYSRENSGIPPWLEYSAAYVSMLAPKTLIS